MLPVISIGALAVPVPALVLILGTWIGVSIAERYSKKFSIHPGRLDSLLITSFIAGVIMARLVYIARYPDAFLPNPASIFSFNPGLLDRWGAVAGVIISSTIYIQRYKLPLWRILDTLTPFFAIMAISIGFSQLASGDAFGQVTDLPWAIELWGARRHPTQLYGIFGASAILWTLWPGRKLIFHSNPGVYFLIWLASSAGTRLFLEAFRGDSVLVLGGFRSAQIIAWLILGLCLWVIGKKLSSV